MINHRHARGLVLDLNADVCPNSFLDRHSRVAEGSQVYFSKLYRSWAERAEVYRSYLVGTECRDSDVRLSVVENSIVSDSKIYDASVKGSEISGANVRGSIIENCRISADCWLGNAELEGLTITEDVRIGTGRWTRVPRFFEINNDITWGVGVTESTDGHAYVGCRRRPMVTWIKGAERFRKVMGWSSETRDLIVGKFEEWLKEN